MQETKLHKAGKKCGALKQKFPLLHGARRILNSNKPF
jgi:hypothetical protein